MSLDVVQAGLESAGITYLRYDGKVPQKDRHGVIERFRHDPSVQVLLLTLSCGAVGCVRDNPPQVSPRENNNTQL